MVRLSSWALLHVAEISFIALHSIFPPKPPSSIPLLSVSTNKHVTPLIHRFLAHDDAKSRTKSSSFRPYPSSFCSPVRAVDKDSRQFEIDQGKAKESLQKLDQQLQALSKKQVSHPKIKASEVVRDEMAEEMPVVSGSFLSYLAVGLLIFTIFYSILFYEVIKPAIDEPELPPMTNETESEAILQ